MNKLLLASVKWLGPMWNRLGADAQQLQVILEAKLKMDGRRRSAFAAMGNRSKKQSKDQDLVTMLIFLLMGITFMLFLVVFNHAGSGFAIYFTAWMVFVTLTLITDFTDVLIDIRDNYILMPRPISDRTITISRLLHIVFYLSKLILAFALPALIAVPIKYGIGGLFLYIFLMGISVILSILFVNLIYLLILRLTSAQRFKDIITYIQIAFTSLIFIGYYLIPQFIDIDDYENLNFLNETFVWFMPSAWLGAFWELAYQGDFRLNMIILSVLALLSPVVSIVLISRFLAKDFNQKMMGIGQGGDTKEKKVQREDGQKRSWRDRSAEWLTNSPAERAGYEWTWNITRRSRTYRVKLYPMFAFVPAYFVFLFFGGEGTVSEKLQELLESNNYIILLYFCFFLLSGSFTMSKFSDNYKAAWVYFAAPVAKPGPIIIGAFKACGIRFFVPFYLLISLFVVAIWGLSALDDIVLAFINIVFLALITGYWTQKELPFSEAWENQNKGSNVSQGIMSMALASLMGAAHYFLVSLAWWVAPVFFVTVGLLILLVYNKYYSLSWQQLK